MPGLLTANTAYSNRLIDNAADSTTLSEVLRDCLRDERFTTLHIATGYWDLPGMTLLVSELEAFLQREGTHIELLIGKDPYVYASMVKKPKYKDATYPDDFIRTDLTDLEVTEQHVRALALLLTHCPGERINVHLYRGTDAEGHEQFLHSKCYIFTGQTYSCGIVGSSNFTGKGLEGNAELNYLEGNATLVTAVAGKGSSFNGHLAWFRDKWAHSTPWSQQFLEKVVSPTPGGHRAHQATAPLTPAELYYKALIDKFGDILDENLSHTLAGYLPKGFTALDYQLDAVKQCRHILHEHGGFLLSDVVGLGKTIVAILLAKHFLIDHTETTPRPRRVLIVAPPAVLVAWRETVARFDADTDTPISPYIDFTTPGRIGQLLGAPLAETPQDSDEAADEVLDLFDLAAESDNPTDEDPDTADALMELDGEQDGNTAHNPEAPTLVSLSAALPTPDYGLLLIDESHRLRHHNTRSYRQLDTLIGDITARHGLCPYIGLLSATPQNNRPQDLRNQIYLFARNRTASTFTKACGGNLEHFFAKIQISYDNLLRNTSISTDERNKALAALAAEIRDSVLQDILVRRTRTDVQRYYNADLRFPDVADPESLHYHLSKGLAELFARTTELIGPRLAGFFDADGNEDTQAPHLSAIGYFRYRALEFFVNPQHIGRYAWRNMTTHRIAVQLARLSQINLIKRFESSFTAFKTSLAHLRHNTQTMIDMWDNDTIFVCPAFDVNALFDRKRRHELTGRRLTFDDVVGEIRQKIAALSPEQNAKGQNAEYRRDDFHPRYIEKLRDDLFLIDQLIEKWNYYSDDPKLDAFKRALVPVLLDPARNPSGLLVIFTESADTLRAVARAIESVDDRLPVLTVTSANRREVEDDIRANFDANYRGTLRNDYRIIVTTDVLAEGINLHRANTILNYDTPWNATRLMQRIGRINRIGTDAERVYVYNFMPSTQGDAAIRLVNKAHTKLQSFHHLFGEDSRIFTPDEQVVHHALNLESGGVSSELERYLYELKRYKDEQPARYAHLAGLATCPPLAVEAEASSHSALCLYHTGDEHTHFAAVDAQGQGQILTPTDFYERLRTACARPAATLPADWPVREATARLALNRSLSQMNVKAAKSLEATQAKELLLHLYGLPGTTPATKALLKKVRPLIDSGNVDVIRRCLHIRRQIESDAQLFPLTPEQINAYIASGLQHMVAQITARHGEARFRLGLAH